MVARFRCVLVARIRFFTTTIMSSHDIHLSVNGAERRERHRVTNRDRAVWERNRSRDGKLDSRNRRGRMMHLNHGTPESNGKNPRRQLFGPPAEPRAFTETVSPTPSKTTNLNDDMENFNRATSSYSPSVGRTAHRKLAMVCTPSSTYCLKSTDKQTAN